MSKFELKSTIETGKILIEIKGRLDESAKLPLITEAANTIIEININDLTGLNSLGIKEWINWLKSIPKEMKIIYKNCPPVFIEELNIFTGFLPNNASIESFYVPYFCESCNKRVLSLIKEPIGNKNGVKPAVPENIQCDKCKNKIELDIILDEYIF